MPLKGETFHEFELESKLVVFLRKERLGVLTDKRREKRVCTPVSFSSVTEFVSNFPRLLVPKEVVP